MHLTKEQTIELQINEMRVQRNKIRHNLTTKYKWNCLHCMKVIYVSFNQYSRQAIFCRDCFILTAKTETPAQYQYMKVLKEKQLNLIENGVYE